MNAAVKFLPEIDRPGCDRETQHDHIVRLLNAGDEEASSGRYAEATLAYYSVFQPGLSAEADRRFRRVAPMGLYEKAAIKLRVVATRYAEYLIGRRCFLAGESPDGPVGVPRGALNLYLISNQCDVFAETALQFAAEEQGRRNINRFLLSSVRARLDHLRSVGACTILLKEEQDAIENLDNFESSLYAHLLSQCPTTSADARTAGRRMKNIAGQDCS